MNFSGIVNLIKDLTEQTTAEENDYLPIGSTNLKKISFANLRRLLGIDELNRNMNELSGEFGSIVDFTPVLYALDGTTEKYAGGYATRVATRKTIGNRVFMDVWLQINNLGTLGTGDLVLRIKGISSENVPMAVSKGLIYSAAVSFVTNAASGVSVAAAVASGQNYISLYNGGNYLRAKNITKDFQIRFSVSYDIA